MYPPLARQAKVSGVVILDVVVDSTGNVTDIKVVSGHPLLIQAAIDSVKQWVYQPFAIGGAPADVVSTVTINFAPLE